MRHPPHELSHLLLADTRRNTCVVFEHNMVVLPVNYVNVFYMGLCISGRSHKKYTYIIDWKHNHMVLQDHAKISPDIVGVERYNFCFSFGTPKKKKKLNDGGSLYVARFSNAFLIFEMRPSSLFLIFILNFSQLDRPNI